MDTVTTVKIAYSLYQAQRKQQAVEEKHHELLTAIRSIKDEIINAIIDVRNSELKGRVRGRLLEFERFTNFTNTELGNYISTSNDIIGQIEQDILDRNLATDNSLVPAYNTLVPLQAAALEKNGDSSGNTLRRAQNLNEKFTAQMKDTVTLQYYFDEDLQRSAWWAKSSFTGKSMGQFDSREEGIDFALSGSSYYLSQKALNEINTSLSP